MRTLLASCIIASACAETSPELEPTEALAPPVGEEADLPLGAVDEPKADAGFGAATTCKPIPVVEPLADPYVVISLDGLTVHLWDRAGTYDRVFPIGPGAIEKGVSLTPTSDTAPGGVFYARLDQPVVNDGPTPAESRWGWNERCNIWWKDETGKQLPVFAGLPFIRLEGPPVAAYGLHGPIDQYTLATGGTLRRGFVSHGCVRLAAADIVELYGRLLGKKVPVRIQKGVETRGSGAEHVDLADRWMQSECQADADCGFSGAVCKLNHYSGRGFCSKACTGSCPDKAGFPTTLCVADPDDASRGLCVLRPSPLNAGCRRFDGFVEVAAAKRFGSAKTFPACLPGSEGWIGDRCFANGDCGSGRTCHAVDGGPAGVCTQACTSTCPDQVGGFASTFCVADPAAPTPAGVCTARCANSDDCVLGTTCEAEPRLGKTSPIRNVCLPY